MQPSVTRLMTSQAADDKVVAVVAIARLNLARWN
jgi:hypothetical protein